MLRQKPIQSMFEFVAIEDTNLCEFGTNYKTIVLDQLGMANLECQPLLLQEQDLTSNKAIILLLRFQHTMSRADKISNINSCALDTSDVRNNMDVKMLKTCLRNWVNRTSNQMGGWHKKCLKMWQNA